MRAKRGEDEGQVFVADFIVNRIKDKYRHAGPISIRNFLNDIGYCALVQKGPPQIIRRKRISMGTGQDPKRHTVWCRATDYARLIGADEQRLIYRNLLGEDELPTAADRAG